MMRVFFRPLAGAVLVLLLTGCAALQVPAPPPPASQNTAVLALLNKARAQAGAEQWDPAAANLERALRIEPRNPVLWQELAKTRLGQGQYGQAENLAAKSNALAGANRSLQAENWRIIGQARSRRGDLRGSQAAFERAEQMP
ncbi:MAG: tetratricopeptide repeat protein [Syntrophotaleaceae bacterium]